MTTNQETAVRHEYRHIVYGEPHCSCGYASDELRVRIHVLREEHDRLAEENARLRAALEDIQTTALMCGGANDIYLKASAVLSRIPASDEAEEEESIMDVAREFAEAGATVHFLEGDGTVTDFEEEPR